MAFPTKMFSRRLAKKLRFPEEGAYDDIALMYQLLAEATVRKLLAQPLCPHTVRMQILIKRIGREQPVIRRPGGIIALMAIKRILWIR